MHVNWRGLLGGVLSGVLPNPDFSAEAYIQHQVFGRRAVSGEVPGRRFSTDSSIGIDASITSGDLVGKTITVKDGIITGYA